MVHRTRRGLRNIYHYPYTFAFVLVFVVLLLLPAFVISVSTLSSTESLELSSNNTLVSSGDVFELGFFNVSSSRWYLGIWFKQVPLTTYVWVANRDNPLNDSTGILKILDANLVILGQSDTLVWTTNLTGSTRSPVVAELLSNGNFVLREISNKNGQGGILWQSFDFPTDTLLPEMKLGWDLKTGLNKYLTSWRSPNDPSSGNYIYKLEIQEIPEFHLFSGDRLIYRTGPWDGIQFSGMPENQQLNYMVYNFTENKEEVAYTFSMTNHSIHSRLTLSPFGQLERFTWIPESLLWNMVWYSPNNDCEMYDGCGAYSYCDVNTSSVCNCIKGFIPRMQPRWELSCVRRTNLSCGGDGFLRLKRMKLPATSNATVDRIIGLKECKKRCLRNCNCTAFANIDSRNGGLGCLIWTGEFLDIRNYSVDGHDLYVRLAASELDLKSNNIGGKIGLIVTISVLLLLCFIIFFIWKRKRKQATESITRNENMNEERDQYGLLNQMVRLRDINVSSENVTEDLELPSADYTLLVEATDNFSDSNKLGEGGFGCVYKGRSLSGEFFAVKRLSELSNQGNDEFEVEVQTISKLQHKNLVRILGCCAYKKEKLLVYEYLENLSLDHHLFDKTRSYQLNWQKRFDIINGIAKGILYLHHDSRTRVVHRDLKASNILLDKNMVPKISDFGMARIFPTDEHEAMTRRIVGTYGYMSPEYAMDGVYSEKSDVFSFGVLLLEIITGKRSRGFFNSDMDSNLLNYVWRHMKEGTEIEVADPNIVDSSSKSPTFQPDEVLRCIKIALLCVQACADDRPLMLAVASMLGNKTEEIPKAEAPGFCVGKNNDTESSSDPTWTFGFTISKTEPR